MRQRRSPHEQAQAMREIHAYAERVCAGLGRRVRAAREARGLTVYALERASGVSREMVARIEAGKSVPTLFLLAKLARALRISLRDLLARLEGPSGPAEGGAAVAEGA